MLQANKVQAQNSIINKMSNLAENIASGNTISNNCEQLVRFNDYFIDPNYDAFLIDNAVKNNCLLFTLMYVYHKQNWKQTIANIPFEAYKNLSYKLQTVYRQNFYHNEVHGADVCQMLYYVIF